MKTIAKRELVRRPALMAHLKRGESVRVTGREDDLVLSRPKRRKLTAAELEAELDRLAPDCPALDCQKILADLRS